MKAPLACLVLALILSGCARRKMLIGLYDVPRSDLAAARAAGFDLVTAAGETNPLAYLDTAHAAGIKVILAPQPGAPIQRLDQHPALWAWYLVDEPDLNIISPEALRARKRSLRRVARKQALVVVASGAAIEHYRDVADIMAVDRYPIPWSSLATVSREMRNARLASRKEPFIAILQAFDWAAFRQFLAGDVPTRAPSRDELRCMAFLSLLHGARHLMFYTYETEKWKLREHAEVWEPLKELVTELRERGTIFQKRVAWWPVQTKYESTEMFNEIEEGAIALAAFTTKQGYYFMAINTTGQPVSFSFRLPFREIEAVDSTCALDGASLVGGWLTRTYAPFEVCILGPIDQKLSLERLP